MIRLLSAEYELLNFNTENCCTILERKTARFWIELPEKPCSFFKNSLQFILSKSVNL